METIPQPLQHSRLTCDRVVGHLQDPEIQIASSVREHDRLDLTWQESQRRFLRKTSRAGRSVGMLLPAGTTVNHGDILHVGPGLVLSVSILPSPIIAVLISTPEESARAAYELGNLHRPVMFSANELLTPASDDLDALLTRCGFSITHRNARFKPYRPRGMPLPRLSTDFQMIPAKPMTHKTP